MSDPSAGQGTLGSWSAADPSAGQGALGSWSAATTTANYQLYYRSRIKCYPCPDALKMAVHALISSKLDYYNSLLAGLPEYVIQKYQHNMNSAACLISGIHKHDHITPILASLYCLPVEHRMNYNLLCLTYKALHGLAPPYLADLLENFSPSRSLHSADHRLLSIPKPHMEKEPLPA